MDGLTALPEEYNFKSLEFRLCDFGSLLHPKP